MTALYAWGANSHGQLGLGFISELVIKPTKLEELPDNLLESSIRLVVGGGGHTFILTTYGRLYGAGWNAFGQVGNGTQARSVSTFQEIRGLEDQHIIDVACGWAHSLALNRQGQVWVWGSNSHSQLGLPRDEVPFSSLPICLSLTNVISIAAGLRHVAVATQDGQVYTWGQGHKGQLGHIDDEGHLVKLQPAPRSLEPLEEEIIQVSCGQNTTYAINKEGHVLAWGDNKFGQLAHDPKNVAFFSCPLTIPQNYFGGKKATWVSAGWTHCAAGLCSGEVYMWGRCDYGQLGYIDEEEKEESCIEPLSTSKTKCKYVPTCLLSSKQIKSFVCGSEHNLALSGDVEEGTSLHSWGWNEHGNCGDGTTINVPRPLRLSIPGSIKLIGAGSGHSFALVRLY